MKTVKKIVFVLFAFVLFAACNDELEIPENPWDIEFTKLNIHAEVNDAEIPVKIDEGFELDLSGITLSCNLTDQAFFSMTGLIKKVETEEEFEIGEGEFELLAQNNSCNLHGSYEGNGTKTGSNFEITATIKVAYGTGVFKADDGQLRLIIKGSLPEGNAETMKYSLNIDGYLERKVQKKF